MQEDTSISDLHDEYKTMDESLENIFYTMIRQGDTLGALNFIRSIDIGFRPSKTVMHTIIFEILMKNDDIKCLAFSYDYLITILRAFPPTNEEHRQFYYDSIKQNHGHHSDLWDLFCHIVNSYFIHRKIYDIENDGSAQNPDPIKYPNCKFLLEFYVKLFTVDFKYHNSMSSCLLMNLLWPNSSRIASQHEIYPSKQSKQTEYFFRWINDMYHQGFSRDAIQGDLLESMHEMLTLMVKCIIQGTHHLSNFEAFSHPALIEIADAIVNFCKNVYASPSNLKLFLASMSFDYLKARVSEKIIKQVVKQCPKRYNVLSLQDIVDQCMFPKIFKCKLSKSVKMEKNLRKRDKKAFTPTVFPDKKKKLELHEATVLHEACKKNKFGDVLQLLLKDCDDVNARDPTGCTPLHEACRMGNFMCVKVLIVETSKASIHKLDFTAANLEGHTALHLAVMKNFMDITKELLYSGGYDLLNITDNKGRCPVDYCVSEEMKKLLQEYQESFEGDAMGDNRISKAENMVNESPMLKSFNDYSIYLHALHCLLCSYSNMFKLCDFIWKKDVQSHGDKCPYHTDQDVCSEDADLILEMPDLIETFVNSINTNVSKLDLNINLELELIPLQFFAASLKPS